MKEKKIIVLTTVFFLLVNTGYFWEPQIGLLALLAWLVLFFMYLALGIIFFQQLLLLFKLKFNDRKKLLIIGGLLLVLITTYIKPGGIINFDRLAGKDLLIAVREGTASCKTVLKIKDNHTFIQRDICFGISEVKGTYEIKGDTILFKKVNSGIRSGQYYPFAVFKPIPNDQSKEHLGALVLYKDNNEYPGRALLITKNELNLSF